MDALGNTNTPPEVPHPSLRGKNEMTMTMTMTDMLRATSQLPPQC